MGVIPPPPPPFVGTDEEKREQAIQYRDALIRMQSQLPGTGPVVFWIVILIGLMVWGSITIWPFIR